MAIETGPTCKWRQPLAWNLTGSHQLFKRSSTTSSTKTQTMQMVSNLMISSCRTARRPPCRLLCQTLHQATFHLLSESLIRRTPTVWWRWREWVVRRTKTSMTRLSSRSRWMILSISATNWRTHWTQFQTTLTCWMTVRLMGRTTTMKTMGRR